MYDDTKGIWAVSNYMDDNTDPNQSDYESKIENDVFSYFVN